MTNVVRLLYEDDAGSDVGGSQLSIQRWRTLVHMAAGDYNIIINDTTEPHLLDWTNREHPLGLPSKSRLRLLMHLLQVLLLWCTWWHSRDLRRCSYSWCWSFTRILLFTRTKVWTMRSDRRVMRLPRRWRLHQTTTERIVTVTTEVSLISTPLKYLS